MACSIADSSFLILYFQTPSKRPIQGNKIAGLSFPGITSEGLHKIRTKQSRCSISFRKTNAIRAVAVPVAPSPSESAEDRKLLCEKYGFRQIGEPLPDNVTLKDIIETLPKKVFKIDNFKALKTVLISATSYSLGLYMIAKAPWYLLPLAWAWAGTAITGFFVIGHDCAHKSFSNNKLVEDIVGTLAMMPLIYPYEPWRFKHDRHHAKTNMLKEDTAWQPVWKEEFDSEPLLRKALILAMGPIRPWASIYHWLVWHFDMNKFRPSEVNRVKISLACVFAFMAIGWPLIIYKTGIVGWVKFWLMPWLGYHFWMSTFTMKGSLGAPVEVLLCDREVTGSSLGSSLLQKMQGKACLHYTLVVGPFPGPSPCGDAIVHRAALFFFFMSTFTMVHHTAPHIPFKDSNEWNAAQAQLNGTVHCDYPRWIEILCHDINVHIPHHISPRIPSYNLREAHISIQENWGKYLNEATWNWRLMKTIMTVCHVYDKDRNYIPFDELAPAESQPIAFLKKVMPDYA